LVRVKNDRVKPNLGGSGLMPGNTKSNFSYLPRKQTEEFTPITALFFSNWANSQDAAFAPSEPEEEETKPSPPVIDWVEESEDESSF
jgi:hypothetical protein